MNKRFALLVLIIFMSLNGCNRSGVDNSLVTNNSQATINTAQKVLPSEIPVNYTLTVFAAASLTGAFQEIGRDFETTNPGVKVRFNFAGSQILRTQIEQGASADIFASADHKNMDLLFNDNLVNANGYQDFATNVLAVILPKSNPGNVQSLTDLSRAGLKLVLADPSVPAGNYARQVLTQMNADPIYGSDFSDKVLANVVSNETDVKQVVTKVELGEGDAGIVYLSDAIATPELVTISIPDKFNITAYYPIAILTSAREPRIAQEFIAYLTSSTGQSVMIKWGFNPVNQ